MEILMKIIGSGLFKFTVFIIVAVILLVAIKVFNAYAERRREEENLYIPKLLNTLEKYNIEYKIEGNIIYFNFIDTGNYLREPGEYTSLPEIESLTFDISKDKPIIITYAYERECTTHISVRDNVGKKCLRDAERLAEYIEEKEFLKRWQKEMEDKLKERGQHNE